MNLNIIWFVLIAILYVGYFVLEGFDFGVGILLPFLGTDDAKRRVIINTIGPHWDGNEVWLITAGGAMFAAFPHWYATLFSGFYLPLLILLLALIIRGVAFEFRGKDDNPKWRNAWDWAIFIGSVVPAFLWGVAFANMVKGVPIDASMNYVGGFWNLLNPYALIGGVGTLLLFTFHGTVYLCLKTTGVLYGKARRMVSNVWVWAFVFAVIFQAATIFYTDIMSKPGLILVSILAVLAVVVAYLFVRARHNGLAFLLTAFAIVLMAAQQFLILFPRLMVSSLNPEWSLTIMNAASGPTTLSIMSIVALIFVPIVLIYQGWTYWVFRKRLTERPDALIY
jgi:cytochrome d ubiquinol oxidase subunit II